MALFQGYLSDCGIDKSDEMYSKLKSRLSFKIFQQISDLQDYESLIAALEKMYVKRRNIYATRNCLVSCKQMSGEGVRAFLLRLNQLAKKCPFNKLETIESIREDWITQPFISGLASGAMCSKLLENELQAAE